MYVVQYSPLYSQTAEFYTTKNKTTCLTTSVKQAKKFKSLEQIHQYFSYVSSNPEDIYQVFIPVFLSEVTQNNQPHSQAKV